MTENLFEQYVFDEPIGLVKGEDRDELIINAINKIARLLAELETNE